MVQNQDAKKLFNEGLKEFAKSNYWTALDYFEDAANLGCEQAKVTELAVQLLYCAGNNGYVSDIIDQIEELADKGNSSACFLMHLIRRNIEGDFPFPSDYLGPAIRGGNEDAMRVATEFFHLTDIDNENSDSFEITAVMMKTAREGNETAKRCLPSMTKGVNPDLVKKVEEYSRTL